MTEVKGREEVFDDFRYLPPEILKHFITIEIAVSNIDGKDLCSDNGDGTCTDEGTFFISEDFVPAMNALGKQYASLLKALEEAKALIGEILDDYDALPPDRSLNWHEWADRARAFQKDQK